MPPINGLAGTQGEREDWEAGESWGQDGMTFNLLGNRSKGSFFKDR